MTPSTLAAMFTPRTISSTVTSRDGIGFGGDGGGGAGDGGGGDFTRLAAAPTPLAAAPPPLAAAAPTPLAAAAFGGDDDANGDVDGSGQSHTPLWVVHGSLYLRHCAYSFLALEAAVPPRPRSTGCSNSFRSTPLHTLRRRPLCRPLSSQPTGGGDGGGSEYRATSWLGAAAAFFIFSKTFEAAASSTSARAERSPSCPGFAALAAPGARTRSSRGATAPTRPERRRAGRRGRGRERAAAAR